MLAIFKALHGERTVDGKVLDFIKRTLAEPPANLGADVKSEESARFFRQHVALETFGYLGTGADLNVLKPFMATSFPQVEISAARAIGKIQSPEADEVLMQTIEGDKIGFAKIMCVLALSKHNARKMIPRLEAFLRIGKDEETGFGGSIMDPRVGTAFPSSVKDSIKALLESWKPSKKAGK